MGRDPSGQLQDLRAHDLVARYGFGQAFGLDRDRHRGFALHRRGRHRFGQARCGECHVKITAPRRACLSSAFRRARVDCHLNRLGRGIGGIDRFDQCQPGKSAVRLGEGHQRFIKRAVKGKAGNLFANIQRLGQRQADRHGLIHADTPSAIAVINQLHRKRANAAGQSRILALRNQGLHIQGQIIGIALGHHADRLCTGTKVGLKHL